MPDRADELALKFAADFALAAMGAWPGFAKPLDRARLAAVIRDAQAEARAEAREALKAIDLRTDYILGMCRGKAEMQAEARAIKDTIAAIRQAATKDRP